MPCKAHGTRISRGLRRGNDQDIYARTAGRGADQNGSGVRGSLVQEMGDWLPQGRSDILQPHDLMAGNPQVRDPKGHWVDARPEVIRRLDDGYGIRGRGIQRVGFSRVVPASRVVFATGAGDGITRLLDAPPHHHGQGGAACREENIL
jgi:hypothetical protein